MGVGGGLSADELTLALNLLVKTKVAQQDVQMLVRELKILDAEGKKARQTLASLGGGAKSSSQGLDNLATSTKKVDSGLGAVSHSTEKAKKSLLSMNNVARTAFGTFVAMGIFLVTKFVGDAIAKTLDSLKQLELAFYKIGIAEKSLSKAGVDITPKDLLSISKEVQSTFEFISKIDSLKMVSNLALLTKDLRLTKEQLLNLAKAIPVLATSADISIESATNQVIGGLTKSGRGWADLGIQVDAAIIKQEAVTAGIVESKEAYEALTPEQKQHAEVLALISLLNKNVADSTNEQGAYLETVAGKTRLLNKAWEDFTTYLGSTSSPVIKLLIDSAITGLQLLTIVVYGLKQAFLFYNGVAVGGLTAIRELLDGNIHSAKQFKEVFQEGGNLAIAEAELLMSQSLTEDTPTAIPPPIIGDEAVENPEDIAGALDKAKEEILKSELKLEQDLTDIAIDLGRKMEDITLEYARKRADAFSTYNEKIADIQRDLSRKLEEMAIKEQERRAEARNDQLEKEREFQNKLQEMKESFLMDLDDALHARDARQILKLIKSYDLEKLQAEREHALDMESSKKDEQLARQSYERERKQAQQEAQDKLADAQRDYQLKLEKLKADEDAEVQAAVLAANRKTQDLMKSNQDRMAIIAADLVNQFNLTKQGLDAVLNLYRQYYGSGGLISQAMAGMNSMLSGQMSQQGQMMFGGTPPPRAGGRPTTSSSGGGNRRAEGGTMLANRSTTVTFGEAGLEMATFTPIGRTGKDMNKTFSNLSGGGNGGGGMMQIEMLLSPELEARIIKNTLGQTAEIILKTSRSK